MRYSAIFRAIYSNVWAILPEKLEAIAAFVELKVSGGSAAPEIVAAIRAENQIAAARVQSLSADKPGSVVVMPLYGIINQRASGDVSGPSGTSVQQFTQQFRQAVADPNVKAIVLDVDSPGGTVSGVDELATEIFNARKQKKITAVSNCLCASAAYWLASQASELVVSPSSMTGSIGVYQLHEDDSQALETMGVKISMISAGRYKTEGNSFEPLGDDARTAMQGVVDDFYSLFTKAVARGRGVAVKAVTGGFGQGRCLTAQDAVKQGLADRIATLDEVLQKYGVQTGSGPSGKTHPGIVSEAPENIGILAGMSTTEDRTANDGECACKCDSCIAGDCAACTHEGCNAEEENCQGCGMVSAEETIEPDGVAVAETEARDRRLRLASL